MREAVIVSAARTPIGRAKKGSLRDTRPENRQVNKPVEIMSADISFRFAYSPADSRLQGSVMEINRLLHR